MTVASDMPDRDAAPAAAVVRLREGQDAARAEYFNAHIPPEHRGGTLAAGQVIGWEDGYEAAIRVMEGDLDNEF
jgi:hypothetical protein